MTVTDAALRAALHDYETVGPSKMLRAHLNCIADAARLVLAARRETQVMLIDMEKLSAAIDAYEQMICIDENEIALECMRLVLMLAAAYPSPRMPA